MGDGVFNIAKGRVVEYYNRVKSNDPSASVLTVLLLETDVVDATMEDYDDVAAILAGASIEAAFTNYARVLLTDSLLAVLPAPDDTNNRYEVDLPDTVWSPAGGAANETLARLIVCYDPLGTDVDANLIPLTFHDFVITTNGGDLTATYDALGFFRAA